MREQPGRQPGGRAQFANAMQGMKLDGNPSVARVPNSTHAENFHTVLVLGHVGCRLDAALVHLGFHRNQEIWGRRSEDVARGAEAYCTKITFPIAFF